MQNSREKNQNRDENCLINDRTDLMISDEISLIHDSLVHEGKTKGMAKGPFLSCRGKLCSGESAGLGLPVWKTRNQTFFPTLVSMKPIGLTTIQKDLRMDRVVAWNIAGKKAPVWFNRAMELLVDEYMKRPSLQQHMLRFRDNLLSAYSVDSTMVQSGERGLCRVFYETTPQGLIVRVDGSALHGQGQLIMLNELDGLTFNRLKMGDIVWTDKDIPAWSEVPLDTILESTSLNLGISLSSGWYGDLTGSRLYCGREVASGLNWAGLAIMSQQQILTYQVNFHTKRV
jgi:hypothetical protein